MTTDPSPVVIHSSLRGLVGAGLAPAALVGLGLAVVTTAGPRAVPVGLAVVGAALGLVTAADYPRHTRFDASGITRVCLLRRHHLPWPHVVAIRRARPTAGARLRGMAARQADARVSGGLVAQGTGRRRWLLTDRVESRVEYDRLAALMSALDTATGLGAARPHTQAPPTDLYRRRRDRETPSRRQPGG